MNKDEKMRKKILNLLAKEVVPKYNKKNKRVRKNHYVPIQYQPNYVARMYQHVKEAANWE